MNHQAGLEYERSFWDQGKHVVGIDEAGRGPIAGPLVVAGAVFDIGYANSEIYDSKALSEKKREKLFSLILREARCYKIKIVTRKKSTRSIFTGRRRKRWKKSPAEINAEAVLTDAMPLLHCSKPTLSIIKGDQKSLSIAAGSILAKVVRDHIMLGYDRLYPDYGFARHKGYPTKSASGSDGEIRRAAILPQKLRSGCPDESDDAGFGLIADRSR